MDSLRDDESRATEALANARERKAELREQLSPMEQATQRIAELFGISGPRRIWPGHNPHRVANGEQPNAFKLKFDRYILGLTRRSVMHANHRLHGMSDGRYQLQRKDPSRKRRTEYKHDRRSQAGLALEVMDAFTGKEQVSYQGAGFSLPFSLWVWPMWCNVNLAVLNSIRFYR